MSDPAALSEILGAEIMRVGIWNGIRWTQADLADIATAAAEVGYTPPVKLGHDESIGARAWGWVKNLRVIGERLIADLMDIPDSLAAVIRERGYDSLSAEVYMDLERDSRKYRRALKAVALLGAEIPAVSDLRPLHELFAECKAESVVFSERGVKMADENEVASLKEEHAAALQKARKMQAEHEVQIAEWTEQVKALKEQTAALETRNFETQLTAKLLAWNGPPGFRPFLEVLYRAAGADARTFKFSVGEKNEDRSLESIVDALAVKLSSDSEWMLKQTLKPGAAKDEDDPGKEINARAIRLTAEKGISYSQAVMAVLLADPDLKAAYAGV